MINNKIAINDSTIMYSSTWQAIQLLPTDELKWEAVKLLMDYGIYEEKPETEDKIVQMVLTMVLPNMNAAKQRYERAVENGNKGGRPEKYNDADIINLRNKGYSYSQITTELGCSPSTIKRTLSRKEKAKEIKLPKSEDIVKDEGFKMVQNYNEPTEEINPSNVSDNNTESILLPFEKLTLKMVQNYNNPIEEIENNQDEDSVVKSLHQEGVITDHNLNTNININNKDKDKDKEAVISLTPMNENKIDEYKYIYNKFNIQSKDIGTTNLKIRDIKMKLNSIIKENNLSNELDTIIDLVNYELENRPISDTLKGLRWLNFVNKKVFTKEYLTNYLKEKIAEA